MASANPPHPVPKTKTVEVHLPMNPLGAELTIDPENGEILIADVVENMPAETHGLLQGHQLAKVNGIGVTGKSLAAVGKMLQGKKAQLTFICHDFDNPSMWAKMLSRGTFCMYKTRADKKYKKMYMWADCHAGTLCWAPDRNSKARLVETLKMTDVSEIDSIPPSGPEHEAHQKRLDMLHHVKTHASKHRQGFASAEEKAAWVQAEKKAHKTRRAKKFEGCIEIACYHDGFLIYDHTKDLKIEGGNKQRDEWMDAIEWYHRVCRKHQLDVIIKRFKSIDQDHSGDIDINELKMLLPGVKGGKAAGKLFAKYDANGDGKLSFEEFVPLLAALEGHAVSNVSASDTRAASQAARSG